MCIEQYRKQLHSAASKNIKLIYLSNKAGTSRELHRFGDILIVCTRGEFILGINTAERHWEPGRTTLDSK